MKRVIVLVNAGVAMVGAMARSAVDQYRDIRDLAEIGPRSIDALQVHASVEEMQIMQYEAQRAEPDHCPACERSIQFAVAQSERIRSILGDRNDDSRTVVDLIDELCEELDKREPSIICGCGAFNGAARTSCYECGQELWPPSGPVRDRQLDRMNGPICPRCDGRGNFPRNEGRPYKCLNCDGTGRAAPDRVKGPCGLCNGVGIVDIGFGQSDTCGGCKGTGRVEK